MKRLQVYQNIDSEREYQEANKSNPEAHIVADFPLGSAILAIQTNLMLARNTWYSGQDPFPASMEYIRKIAAICVQMGEKYGMAEREINKQA